MNLQLYDYMELEKEKPLISIYYSIIDYFRLKKATKRGMCVDPTLLEAYRSIKNQHTLLYIEKFKCVRDGKDELFNREIFELLRDLIKIFHAYAKHMGTLHQDEDDCITQHQLEYEMYEKMCEFEKMEKSSVSILPWITL